MKRIREELERLRNTGNYRTIPTAQTSDGGRKLVDLTANDYLGLASDESFIESFFSKLRASDFVPTSSASRLLASRQEDYAALEDELGASYGRRALLFNSGYHANTGIIKALADKNTLFLADKLVHASIIDGLNLAQASGAAYMRFRHNDYDHLEKLIVRYGQDYRRVIIIAESVYSMDGDRADLTRLITARDMHPSAMIYLDEAHGVGVVGEKGLGLAYSHPQYVKIDIVVGTFGKALASAGAYCIVNEEMREYLVNTARSLIFSTALPPLTAKWSLTTFRYSKTADDRRERLNRVSRRLAEIIANPEAGHIQPLVVRDARKAVIASEYLRDNGFRVLPIRTPTVPAGTERLRFSLSASLAPEQLDPLRHLIAKIL